MKYLQLLKNTSLHLIWFFLLCFPLVGMRFDNKRNLTIMWDRMIIVLACIFVASVLWQLAFSKEKKEASQFSKKFTQLKGEVNSFFEKKSSQYTFMLVVFTIFAVLPLVSSLYQVTIFSLALIYVMLALGLNIVVGVAGQLVLGYAAFYAVGAYTYALLNMYYGLSFWVCLPLGGLFAALAGLALGFPVLRLRGDYLAIVTLGFGEITRLLFNNLSDLTMGSRGVSNIPRPALFGLELDLTQSTTYIYYIAFFATILTIIIITRLKNSRVGLALQAMKEDEIACEAMGINLRKTKLMAFALGSCWAGFAGVILAARNTYINPASFTFMDSAMILAMVVLGGMGSIWGVVLAALLLSLLPEYLRAFSEYRMLIFGVLMVLMMLFRPQGMIPSSKRKYSLSADLEESEKAENKIEAN